MGPFEKIITAFYSLVIFRNLQNDKVLIKFFQLLESLTGDSLEQVKKYSSFVSELFNSGYNFTEYLLHSIINDVNFFVVDRSVGKPVQSNIEELLSRELEILQEISRIDADRIKSCMKYNGFLPAWDVSDLDFKAEYNNKIENIRKNGYGVYSEFHMFTIKHGEFVPVKFPDTIKLSQLKGYAEERKAVINNTLALLKDKPAANVLLYGDAGTGKSSTVKAIANEYKGEGLRLIEVKKNQLQDIPDIIERINCSCLKYILFIDDLSFTKNSDDFGVLKSVLEGSLMAKPPNVAIYATSNRRHLLKESFADREGDDIHVNETLQETASLSERFGLTVYFEKPNKEQFLRIVQDLVSDYKIDIDMEDLNLYAEQYALLRGGRSPRIARQLIESFLGMHVDPNIKK